MSSKPFQVVLWILFIGVSAAGLVLVRLDNARLRKRVVVGRQQGEKAARLRDDNTRTRDILVRTAADEGDGARAIHADVVRARTGVGDLEARARESHRQMSAQAAKDAESLASNRDPDKGMTRLEYFQNMGQGTPAAAFQTFVWAALKGDDEKLAGMIAFSGPARPKAEAVVAALPDEARAKYSTPEKLAALFFAAALTGMPSAEVTGVSLQESNRATVDVRGLTAGTEKVPMQLGATGWQIVLSSSMADKLGGWVRNGAPPEKK